MTEHVVTISMVPDYDGTWLMAYGAAAECECGWREVWYAEDKFTAEIITEINAHADGVTITNEDEPHRFPLLAADECEADE